MPYPIVLAHGIARFDVLLRDLLKDEDMSDDRTHYFRRIRSTLQAAGFPTYHSSVPWAECVGVRSRALRANVEQVLAATGARKVHIIGAQHGRPRRAPHAVRRPRRRHPRARRLADDDRHATLGHVVRRLGRHQRDAAAGDPVDAGDHRARRIPRSDDQVLRRVQRPGRIVRAPLRRRLPRLRGRAAAAPRLRAAEAVLARGPAPRRRQRRSGGGLVGALARRVRGRRRCSTPTT